MLNQFRLNVVFYKTTSKNEPVREWLQSLTRNEKKIIGEDIKTVQLGWPSGMPLVRKLDSDVWEIRSHLKNKIARILFTIIDDQMILLHGFIKKSLKTPKKEIRLAKTRGSNIRRLEL
ncbi:MAG: type II toxin-antitoxin system RelE/ParE family toxin [Calditrichaeota bacterium]|nr:type II toxin-antitoxin system RelE/ParE family toxin [Calditrichota bacterium]